ncbi:MAG TPA: hypothetical protein VK699_20025 [Terriglobales bacterium]|jgi:hypothetical protein|nr:hypothetical protein [Terriglobales bacterium]
MGFCECSTQRINNLGYCWECAQPVRMVEVLLFGEMPFHVIERLIEQRATQLAQSPPAAPEAN